MPLILAIEPDRRQAAQLTGLVRRHIGAELVLADTTARAIDAIGQRVPDLVLVHALLSPQDDAALAAALRVIAAAAHVQTLMIPVLGDPQQKTSSHGVLSMLRRGQSRAASPDGCDPTVFAEQIVSYLERVTEGRAAATAVDTPAPAANQDMATIEAFAIDAAMERLEPVVDPTPAVIPAIELFEPVVDGTPDDLTLAVEAALASEASPADPPLLFAASDEQSSAEAVAVTIRQRALDEEMMTLDEGLSSPMEELSAKGRTQTNDAPAPELDPAGELDEVSVAPERSEIEWIGDLEHMPRPESSITKGRAEWGELIESLRRDLERLDAEHQQRSGTAPASHADEVQTSSSPWPAARPGPRIRDPRRRSRKRPPLQDEWGLFDPEQCGFAELLAKLEEITEEHEPLTRRGA